MRLGMDAVAAVLVHHELAKSDPGFTLAYLAHAVLFVNNFFHAANEEQRARLLPKTLTGEHVACMCMTEPNAGTDVLGMSTVARREGDEYISTAPRPSSPTRPIRSCSSSTPR